MYVVSVDPGIRNLGVVCGVVVDNRVARIEKCIHSDITKLIHNRVSEKNCTLHHSNDTCDRIRHFLQEHEEDFHKADRILIERQPIGGLKDVEQLIHDTFREKSTLVSPTKMHIYFGISKLSYDERKVKTIEFATPHLDGNDAWHSTDDKSHVADACCILLYYCKELRVRTSSRRILDKTGPIGNQSVEEFLETFRFRHLSSRKTSFGSLSLAATPHPDKM